VIDTWPVTVLVESYADVLADLIRGTIADLQRGEEAADRKRRMTKRRALKASTDWFDRLLLAAWDVAARREST
jgi:hypothetical protein